MSSPPPQAELTDEHALKDFWRSTTEAANLVSRAFECGLHADCLSWVFISAYQCAQRQVFEGIPAAQWWAFAASEDRSGELPGMSIEDGALNGYKTWLATSDNVDQVIVTADKTCFVVERHAQGVEIETYPPAKFLGDMSVGRLHFKNVTAFRQLVMNGDFGLAEPFYISAAGCGYLLRQTERLGLETLHAEVAQQWAALTALGAPGYADNLTGFANVYRRVASLGKAVSAAAVESGDASAADWQANGKLLGMYRQAIEARIST